MRIPLFYGMLLLVLLLIYILEARSVALKQGETVANEKIVVCLLSLAITAFFASTGILECYAKCCLWILIRPLARKISNRGIIIKDTLESNFTNYYHFIMQALKL